MTRAALIVAGALLVAGCGGSSSKPAGAGATSSQSGPRVSLNLKGGTGARQSACGAEHHYTQYAAHASVEFAGTVTPVPAGRWKVKLKVKRCRGDAFATVAKVDAERDKHSGSYRGVLPSLPAGSYFARASVYVNGTQTARSDKQHFSLR